MKNDVILSIIIPFYNTKEFILETLNSILKQDNIDQKLVEIIIVDDGSSQKIDDILGNFKNKLSIFYYKKNNLCNGQYITIIDSDDIYESNSLQYVFEELIKKSPDMLIGNFTDWDSKRNKKNKKKILFLNKNKFATITNKNKYILKTPYSFPLGKFYRREVFLMSSELKEGVFYQDINLYYNCLENSKNFVFMNKVLAHHRNDRIDSSSNIKWDFKKLDQWIYVLEFLISKDAAMNAIFYATVPGFKTKFKKENKPKIIFNKVHNCYLPKVLYSLSMIYVFFIIKTYKIFKKNKF